MPSINEDIIVAASNEDVASDYGKKLAESEKKDKFDDHKRAISYKRNLHWIVVIGLWVLGIILLSLIIIRAWHLAAPDCWKWLSDPQLHSIDAVLLSSIIISLASRYFSYYKVFEKK